MKLTGDFKGMRSWALKGLSRRLVFSLTLPKWGWRLALCLSTKNGFRHFQIKEKFKTILIPGNMLPTVFCCVLRPFCYVSVLLLILIMEYNSRYGDSGSSLQQANFLPKSPRGRQREKHGLDLHVIPYKGRNGSFPYKCHCCGLMLLFHPTKHERGTKCANRNTAQLLGSFLQRAEGLAKHSLKLGM